ncbi:hypothetical protein DEJ17_09070 [Curtobacterium sp. MCSS17_011]|uniref:DUF11 domain-containing protein n=1 Tax=Curtobacterium sp. MCSS17_011 TaxID=2175643 RepID=UPI000D9378BE|nr:DUF11 domain-containing protein [Curtobacterium sp. MCSS17_011]PYY57837.1 hypothetical protein DEJ17_09070 [Curtobacterium sp. MCSS17_011]
MTRPSLRSTLGSSAASVLLVVLASTAQPAAAAAKSTGVNLQLAMTGSYIVYDKDPVSYTFTVTNVGKARATSSTLQWKYQAPVQPKAVTSGGYVGLHVASPKAANCSVDTEKHIATCHLNPLAPGKTTKVRFAGTADSKGAGARGLDGAYAVTLTSTPKDDYDNNNSFTGGWGISTRR